MKMISAEPSLFDGLNQIENDLRDMQIALQGDWTRGSKDEAASPSIMSRVWQSQNNETTQGPTATNRKSYDLAKSAFAQYMSKTNAFFSKVSAYEETISKAGAPYTPGRKN